MFSWIANLFSSGPFMPHGQCYLWIPSLLWLHFWSDLLIGTAYVGISILLYVLVRKIRLPFSPVFIAFGLFIGLCGGTHFMEVWTIWNPDYWLSGAVKAATAVASVATAIGLVYVKPQIEEVVHAARLSEERRVRLESTNAELAGLYEKLKRLDKQKTDFFANVSHELRTPLALILGPAQQLLADETLGTEHKRQAEGINRAAKLLLKQVNDLLDVAKLEAGGMRQRYAELDLVPWVRALAAQFQLRAEQRGLGFEVETPVALTAQVDPDMIERAVINLLSNAFKFTPAGGQVRLELSEDEQHFRLSVADTGPGVPTAEREAVFERFTQVDGSATRQHGGTGLGLAIVKDFVELHGGTVGLDDAPRGGALFTLRVPRLAPSGSAVETRAERGAASRAALEGAIEELAVTAGAAPVPARPGAPERPQVLVVEDNADMRHFVREVLSPRYEVLEAADGQAGLDEARALRPDLIVTDMMMPGMSGEELVQALRDDRTFDAVPILLLTAKADDELRVRVLREGAQDFLAKPFLPDELSARASNLIAAKRAGDALRRQLTSASTDLEALAEEVALRNRQLQTALDVADVAREQAERASEVKGCFLGLVSHELRTPLTALQLNLQLLGRTRPLPEGAETKLARLLDATRRMADLVEGLLEYTRLESGRMVVRYQSLELAELVGTTVAEYQALPSAKPVDVVFEPPARALDELECDPRLLRVLLCNLISNALKFTEQGQVTVRLAQREESRVIEVQDTGVGIPLEDQARMFLPFEQLEPVQRKSTPGVGLGLALVKEIADALCGRVELESRPGQGSTFRVILPGRRPAGEPGILEA